MCWKVILAAVLFSVCHLLLRTQKGAGYFQTGLPPQPPFWNILEYSAQLSPFFSFCSWVAHPKRTKAHRDVFHRLALKDNSQPEHFMYLLVKILTAADQLLTEGLQPGHGTRSFVEIVGSVQPLSPSLSWTVPAAGGLPRWDTENDR